MKIWMHQGSIIHHLLEIRDIILVSWPLVFLNMYLLCDLRKRVINLTGM